MSSKKIALIELLSWLSNDEWVCIKVDGYDVVFFGHIGNAKDVVDLTQLVYKRVKHQPIVYAITHLEGFKHGLAIKCK